jgi:hypothetical protein
VARKSAPLATFRLLAVTSDFGLDHPKVLPHMAQASQHRIEQFLGCACIAAGRMEGRNDFLLSRNAGPSLGNVLYRKDVVLVLTRHGAAA